MSNYASLWLSIRNSLCDHHDIATSSFDQNDIKAQPIRKKAYLIFLIEVVTFEYRKNEINIWFKQSFDGTLGSFIFNKIGLLPDQYDKLSDSDRVAILQKYLTEYPLPEAVQTYLQNLLRPSASDNFDVDLAGGWTLGSGWQYL
ncbi:hypothetical protein AB7459_19500 [Providencia rettgeri]|uniref:Uncharacterized protein n=1 Tax=Providencia stuartii TaxID=588 RepID=A0AAI9GG34_PROST|nr:hypothetical protein [Providencia manganoxydans]ELR5113203.1 hypothetical protein [Providencia stuartii]MDX4943964.1 hypothetical protein [Providencia manganoxydans]